MFRSTDLAFDAGAHTYTLPDGTRVPSVTQILRATGVSTDFEALPNRDAIARKRDLGVAVHADCHAFDDDDLAWASVHPDVLPYVEAWAIFREHKRLTPIVRERAVYHPILRYAGTLDGIFEQAGCPVPILIDIKCGDPEQAGARYQTEAYRAAYATAHPAFAAVERWSVQLTPERRVPYVITPYADWQDAEVWRAIVTTFYAAARRAA